MSAPRAPRAEVHVGDALDVLRTLPDSSADALVTDPPAGIAFMGAEWDKAAPRLLRRHAVRRPRPVLRAAGREPRNRRRTDRKRMLARGEEAT